MISPEVVVPKVVDRIRENRHIVGAVLAALLTTAAIVVLFVIQAHIYQQAIASRDSEIGRLAVNYAKLRDQDFSLQVTPAAPSLAQVEDPKAVVGGLPLPRSFTASFPDGYFTCTDKAGDGNFSCTVNHLSPATTTKP